MAPRREAREVTKTIGDSGARYTTGTYTATEPMMPFFRLVVQIGMPTLVLSEGYLV